MTRRQLLHLLTAAPALAVTGCTAQSASSEQEKPLILRYAENQPEDYPTSKAARAFAELVAQRTSGRVKVLFTAGQSWAQSRASSSRCSSAGWIFPACP